LRQTIYIDVLMAVNFIINYFLLLACAHYLSEPVRRGRLAAASGLGAVFSLAILLPEIPAAPSMAVKLLMSACIVLCAFRYGGIKHFLRCTATFYLVSFAFAGLMIALWYFFAPQGLVIRNSVVYFNLSPVLLIALAAACYGIIRLVNRLAGRAAPKGIFCRVSAARGGVRCEFTARVDTGNSLREPFSGDPVVVANRAAVERIVPPEGDLNLRLIPFQAVSGSGVLKGFRPDRLAIRWKNESIQAERVYIAVSEKKLAGCDALLNPDLLQNTSGQIGRGRALDPPKRRGERE